MPHIRIKGLVAVMNRARAQWGQGIPTSEADAFRQMVSDTVAQTERICRKHGVTPKQLPAPSYRAYCYLKSLDLTALPLREDTAHPPPRPVRLKNAVALAARIRADLLALAVHGGAPNLARSEAQEFLARIQAQVKSIEEICQQHHSTPANLPTPSRRAYQWLKFLSAPDNLLAQWFTLATANELIARMDWLKARFANHKIELELYPSEYIYRARASKGVVNIVAAPGFIGAPESVIEALIKSALSRRQKAARALVTAYIHGDDFAEASWSFELFAGTPQGAVKGQHYDLAEVFARVNRECFGGAMPRPQLAWSKTITVRTMGYYQPESDTVMISATLDSAETPPHVIDFVMYHELLHKQMGSQFVNGRRQAHNAAFREAERKFKHYAKAETFLKRLAEQR